MRSYVMQSQLNVYREYLPTNRQMTIVCGVLLVLLLVPSISTTIFGQTDEANAITDQTVQIVNDATKDEKPNDETPTSTTQTEEPAPETPSTAAETKDEDTAPAKEVKSDASDLPTTGPAETLSATLGIIAIAVGYRHFMRSRAVFDQSVTNS